MTKKTSKRIAVPPTASTSNNTPQRTQTRSSLARPTPKSGRTVRQPQTPRDSRAQSSSETDDNGDSNSNGDWDNRSSSSSRVDFLSVRPPSDEDVDDVEEEEVSDLEDEEQGI